MTPSKLSSAPRGICTATARAPRDFSMSPMARRKFARSRSILLTKAIRGISASLAHSQTSSVWTLTPEMAEIMTTAPPRTRRHDLVSAMKSPYPGVSIRWREWPFHSPWLREEVTVIFLLISSGSKSMVEEPSSTRPRRSFMPTVKRMASVREVLPAPPWATIPTFLTFAVSYFAINPP